MLIVLGDHQPVSTVSSAGGTAGHDVPVTVVARDPLVLRRIAELGLAAPGCARAGRAGVADGRLPRPVPRRVHRVTAPANTGWRVASAGSILRTSSRQRCRRAAGRGRAGHVQRSCRVDALESPRPARVPASRMSSEQRAVGRRPSPRPADGEVQVRVELGAPGDRGRRRCRPSALGRGRPGPSAEAGAYSGRRVDMAVSAAWSPRSDITGPPQRRRPQTRRPPQQRPRRERATRRARRCSRRTARHQGGRDASRGSGGNAGGLDAVRGGPRRAGRAARRTRAPRRQAAQPEVARTRALRGRRRRGRGWRQ